MSSRIHLAIATACAISAPAFAQVRTLVPVKPATKPLAVQRPNAALVAKARLEFAPLKTTTMKLSVAGHIARPGKQNAAGYRNNLTASNVAVRKTAISASGVVTTLSAPGISTVNGHGRGDFEPGGDYEIHGRGFGAANGAVFLRFGGRTFPLSITHWSDGQIFAHVPDDISGQPDIDSIELDIGPAGKPVLKTSKFGFRAARADLALPITNAMFSYDPAITMVFNTPLPTRMAPSAKSYDGEYYNVSRQLEDDSDGKKCMEPGTDRIKWNVPLTPGFEVTGYYWYHATDTASQDGRVSYTPRGHYAANWEGDFLRIDYGVMRIYKSGNAGTALAIPGSYAHGACTSSYKAKLIVTGPRGLAPTS